MKMKFILPLISIVLVSGLVVCRELVKPSRGSGIDISKLRVHELFVDPKRARITKIKGSIQNAEYLIWTDADNLQPLYSRWISSQPSESALEGLPRRVPLLMAEINASGHNLKYPLCSDYSEGNFVVFAWLNNNQVILQLNR